MKPQLKEVLYPGVEKIEGVEILISMTNMSSEGMKKALIKHFVDGAEAELACLFGGVSPSNFSRDRDKLNEVARRIDEYLEINYKQYRMKATSNDN